MLRRVGLAAFCAWTLYSSVASFAAVRIRVAQDQRATPAGVTLPLQASSNITNRQVVLICRVRNLSDSPLGIEIKDDNSVLSHADVAPRDVRRIDVVWNRSDVPGGAINVAGSHEEWVIESAELANLHGFSRGLLNFVVLPTGQSVERPSLWLIALITIGTFMLLGVDRPMPRWVSRVRLTSLAVVGALFLAANVSALVSSYRLVLAPRTFALGLAVLLAPALVAAAARLRLNEREGSVQHVSVVVACAAIAAGFYGSAMLQTLAEYGGNYSGFLHISSRYASTTPFLVDQPDIVRTLRLSDEGYDGQFMYVMAFDPFLFRFRDDPGRYADVVDFPSYRYGRIGFSMLTRTAAASDPFRYPATMLWLVVLAHCGIGALLAVFASEYGVSPWKSLVYLVIPGFMSSLMFGLPESLAALGLLAGLWCWRRDRVLAAVLIFAASLLIRETGVIFVAVVLGWTAIERRSVAPALALGASLLPMVAWRFYVALRLFDSVGWAGVFPNPGVLDIPFAGLYQLITAGLAGSHVRSEIPAALSFPFVLSAAVLVSAVSIWRIREPLGVAALAFGFIAISQNYRQAWSHVPSGERTTYELFLSLLLVWFASHGRDPWLRKVLLAFFVVVTVYTFMLSPEASTSRAALLLVR